MSRKLSAVIAALVVAAVPAAAQAKRSGDQPNHGQKGQHGHKGQHGKGRSAHAVAYEVRGTVKAVDATAGTLTVTVSRTNHNAASFQGQDVTFSLADARLKVSDVNKDGNRDVADISVGDDAKVLAKLPRDTQFDASQTYAAKRVVVKHPEAQPSGDDTGSTPPSDSGSTPPSDSGSTPPSDSGSTPPSDSGSTTPSNSGSAAPSNPAPQP